MKWKPSDTQGELGIAITHNIITRNGDVFRRQEQNDRGIDAHVELVQRDTHEATGEIVALQIKGGPAYFQEVTTDGVIFRGSLDHLDYWLNHCLPVFLVLVDTTKQIAFWQKISDQTVEKLRRGWKVEVPFTNNLETNFVAAAHQSLGLETAAAQYTRIRSRDNSGTTTKRHLAHILARPPVTRLRMEAVVRRATADTGMMAGTDCCEA